MFTQLYLFSPLTSVGSGFSPTFCSIFPQRG